MSVDGKGLRRLRECAIGTEVIVVQGYSPPVEMLPSTFSSPKEHRAFFFYLEKTSRQVSGIYESQFWNRLVLQAAYNHPAIRYALVALGSLHEEYEKTGDAETQQDFALQQYNLAIGKHLEALNKPNSNASDVDSYVASSMIFMCIELMQGHYLSALSLIQSAVKLYYNECSRTSSAWPAETLETLLGRLQSQAVMSLSTSVVGRVVPPTPEQFSAFAIPEQFKSVAEAKECLEFWNQSRILKRNALGQPPDREDVPVSMYLSLLAQWSLAFNRMTASVEMTAQDRLGADVVRVWQLMLEIALAIRLNNPTDRDDQTLYDFHEDKFRQTVQLSESVLSAMHGDSGNKASVKHRFTLDVGLVGPLYDTARICRDPGVRREAIRLLRSYPCREGLWDSVLAAASADRQLQLEEAAVPQVTTSADIPGWARISSADPTFHAGQRWTTVVFTRQRPLDGTEPLQFREIIVW